MPKITIVTDSTSYFTKAEAERKKIEVVPLSVTLDEITQKEGFPGEYSEYFERLKSSKHFPTTSQPSTGDFVQVYEKALNQGNEVLAIVISSKISGTYNSASVAAKIVSPDKITVVDSLSSAANLKWMADIAAKMAENDAERTEIVAEIERIKKGSGIHLTVDTLEYLRKGGRLSSAQAILGTMLNIRPVISLIDGELCATGKARGLNNACHMIADKIRLQPRHIAICHIFNDEAASKMKTELIGRWPNVDITIEEIGPVIGSHLGPGAIGVCYINATT